MNYFDRISKIKEKEEGKNISIKGWVINLNKMGRIIFLKVRDARKSIQVLAKELPVIELVKKLKNGDLIEVYGELKKKQTNLKNRENELSWEIVAKKIKIINKSKSLPFELKEETILHEDNKYKYRYLDLRRERSKELLIAKSKFLSNLKKYLYSKEFLEIETPVLGQNSPEGANCFLVASELKERYYSLSQSPQIFKQLLMIGGMNKYFQWAKSFRKEKPRSNRQIEFSQLDLEVTFVSEKKLRNLIEKMLINSLNKTFKNLSFKFQKATYKEVMAKYGTEKPDLRKEETNKEELQFLWITKWPLFEYNSEIKSFRSLRHVFTLPEKKFRKSILSGKSKNYVNITSESFDLVCNGEEILSGSLRIYEKELQEKIFEINGYNKKQIEDNFGYFLEALEFAAPPHGGAGIGIDRLLKVILKTNNLKELISFPKNLDGTCSLTGAPNQIKNKLC